MATRWQLGVNRRPPHKIARREKDRVSRGYRAAAEGRPQTRFAPKVAGRAQAGNDNEPAMGGILQFRIVSQVQSVDDPTVTLKATDPDGRFRYQASLVPLSTT